MGSQYSKSAKAPARRERRLGGIDGNVPPQITSDTLAPVHSRPTIGISPVAIAVREPLDESEISIDSQHADEDDSSSVSPSIQENQQKTCEKILEPSILKRFFVNVPETMAAGDVMTIKLNGDLTKIIITTPTTSSHRPFHHDNYVDDNKRRPSSETVPSIATLSSTGSSSFSPCSEKQLVDSKSDSAVLISSEAKVPVGKILVHAKPVIVIHAEFSQTNTQLKEFMIAEVMREIMQETANNGCNSILGLTVSVKALKDYDQYYAGFLVKACGTPCLLMPDQVLLER